MLVSRLSSSNGEMRSSGQPCGIPRVPGAAELGDDSQAAHGHTSTLTYPREVLPKNGLGEL